MKRLLLCIVLTVLFMPTTVRANPFDEHVAAVAQVLGLTVDKIGPDAKTKILGQWFLEGVRDKECTDGFFFEFFPDGTALDSTGDRFPYTVGSRSIDIEDSNFPLSIYQLSGDFYLPSRECMLAELVRGPAKVVRPR